MKTSRQLVAVGGVNDFPIGEFRILTVRNREIGIIRFANGEYRAVLNRCPHRGAPVCKGTIGGTWPPCEPGELQFGMNGGVLVCPWHGYEFDLANGVELYQEQPSRLRLFPVSVQGDTVFVEV